MMIPKPCGGGGGGGGVILFLETEYEPHMATLSIKDGIARSVHTVK